MIVVEKRDLSCALVPVFVSKVELISKKKIYLVFRERIFAR